MSPWNYSWTSTGPIPEGMFWIHVTLELFLENGSPHFRGHVLDSHMSKFGTEADRIPALYRMFRHLRVLQMESCTPIAARTGECKGVEAGHSTVPPRVQVDHVSTQSHSCDS